MGGCSRRDGSAARIVPSNSRHPIANMQIQTRVLMVMSCPPRSVAPFLARYSEKHGRVVSAWGALPEEAQVGDSLARRRRDPPLQFLGPVLDDDHGREFGRCARCLHWLEHQKAAIRSDVVRAH